MKEQVQQQIKDIKKQIKGLNKIDYNNMIKATIARELSARGEDFEDKLRVALEDIRELKAANGEKIKTLKKEIRQIEEKFVKDSGLTDCVHCDGNGFVDYTFPIVYADGGCGWDGGSDDCDCAIGRRKVQQREQLMAARHPRRR